MSAIALFIDSLLALEDLTIPECVVGIQAVIAMHDAGRISTDEALELLDLLNVRRSLLGPLADFAW